MSSSSVSVARHFFAISRLDAVACIAQMISFGAGMIGYTLRLPWAPVLLLASIALLFVIIIVSAILQCAETRMKIPALALYANTFGVCFIFLWVNIGISEWHDANSLFVFLSILLFPTIVYHDIFVCLALLVIIYPYGAARAYLTGIVDSFAALMFLNFTVVASLVYTMDKTWRAILWVHFLFFWASLMASTLIMVYADTYNALYQWILITTSTMVVAVPLVLWICHMLQKAREAAQQEQQQQH